MDVEASRTMWVSHTKYSSCLVCSPSSVSAAVRGAVHHAAVCGGCRGGFWFFATPAFSVLCVTGEGEGEVGEFERQGTKSFFPYEVMKVMKMKMKMMLVVVVVVVVKKNFLFGRSCSE